MSDRDEVNEFEAAALMQMSPTLLKAFTTKSPKKGETRTLPFSKTGTHVTYSRKELLSFDEYLRKPWPAEDDKRPYIPLPIKKEVRAESFLQCAVCHSHADTCEIAHIEPVASSKCNHPHNLILLCANHHTKFDKQGVLGPRQEVLEVVQSYKNIALHTTRVMWGSYASTIAECFALAQLCAHLMKKLLELGDQATIETVKCFESLAEQAVSRLSEKAYRGKVQSRKKTASSTPEELWEKLEKSVAKPTARARLASTAELTLDEDFRAAAGFVECPLCEGSGSHGESVCPVCNGEREVDSVWAKRVDLEPYRLVRCPLCNGSGRHDGEDCPVCRGDRRIEQRFADQVDLTDFDEVECPLCEGEGRWDSEDCPACHGNRRMPRRFAERVDVQAYDKVDCPVCSGSGRGDDGESCRACGGDGQVTCGRRDEIDVRDYINVRCQLCEGSGTVGEMTCPPCGGQGTMPRWAYDETDWREYHLVRCSRCRGSGVFHENDCTKCAGRGKVFRRFADDE